MDIANIKFNIVKHAGMVNTATLDDGTVVYREDKVWIKEYTGFVKCAPTDNHFVFIFPENNPRWKWFSACTCGSPAVILGSTAYGHLGSPEGMMIVCHHYVTFGRHADGSQ